MTIEQDRQIAEAAPPLGGRLQAIYFRTHFNPERIKKMLDVIEAAKEIVNHPLIYGAVITPMYGNGDTKGSLFIPCKDAMNALEELEK